MGAVLLPRRCLACQALLPKQVLDQPGVAGFVCPSCANLIHLLQTPRCQRCGLALGPRPQAFGWTHCRHCRPLIDDDHTPRLDCVVCCDYLPPFDQWVTLLKYGKNPGLASSLGAWLAHRLHEQQLALPDVLLPVPASRNKLKQRGYNQAALIAGHVGRRIRRPVKKDWLVKCKEVEAQADLDRTDRLHNLQGAFQATRPISRHLRIGLVDDVITTGATTQCCAEALYKAGAEHITLLAICRTPE